MAQAPIAAGTRIAGRYIVHRLLGEFGDADQRRLVRRHFIDDEALGGAEMLVDPGAVGRGEGDLEHGFRLLPNGPDQLQPT